MHKANDLAAMTCDKHRKTGYASDDAHFELDQVLTSAVYMDPTYFTSREGVVHAFCTGDFDPSHQHYVSRKSFLKGMFGH